MKKNALTYFDNAATSFPKPVAVASAITEYLTETGGTYGRSAHGRAFRVSAEVEACRDALADALGTETPECVSFAHNATHASNLLLRGLNLKGTVWHSPMEHNAIMRPLEYLRKKRRIQLRELPAGSDGKIQLDKLDLIGKDTALVVVNHQSNVNGVIQPLREIKKAIGETPILVDASQSLGNSPVKTDEWELDYVIFTGHKSLLGPTGTGGFFARHSDLPEPLLFGGTGSQSDSLDMPAFAPDKFEAGTPNVAGIFGLLGALQNRPEPEHTPDDFRKLLEEIEDLPQYEIYRAKSLLDQGETFSLRHRSIDVSELNARLYHDFGIETRSGLHCAPMAHRFLGTFPQGTCRVSLSPYHRPDDLAYLLDALKRIEK
ncbi:cysteine desulfurase (plasmid) [Fulvitalea axinellae]|uniref:Cysteine desulfurase n=1 Tax=Fulvitalea axinellae TaxID=1182444 RepID=A0AAU9D0T6_9BACT|nr:cysteine desulfurase [Fulvitalea axinellae]